MKNFKGRRFIIVIGFLFIALLGWLTGYMISTPLTPQLPQKTELDQIQQDLTEYIAARLKTEKHSSELLGITLQSPVQEADGSLTVPYTLSFREVTSGEATTSVVRATAVLRRAKEAWRVTKVMTAGENVVYENSIKVTPSKAD